MKSDLGAKGGEFKMHQAFVRFDDGWRAGVVVGNEIIIYLRSKPVTLEQAKRSMYLAQDVVGVRIVFNNYKPYEALVITNDETIPTRVRFGKPKQVVVSRKGCLLSLLSRRFH